MIDTHLRLHNSEVLAHGLMWGFMVFESWIVWCISRGHSLVYVFGIWLRYMLEHIVDELEHAWGVWYVDAGVSRLGIVWVVMDTWLVHAW
jgi:hypothetical protein